LTEDIVFEITGDSIGDYWVLKLGIQLLYYRVLKLGLLGHCQVLKLNNIGNSRISFFWILPGNSIIGYFNWFLLEIRFCNKLVFALKGLFR
jgi:hypothetical protein